jgi:hypothetical protein
MNLVKTMERLLGLLLTKLSWIVNLITLTIVAYFLAEGTSAVISMKILDALPARAEIPESRMVRRRPAHRRPFTPKSGEDILARNIFDSIVGPIDPNGEPTTPAEEETTDEDTELAPCDEQDVKLLATVVSDTNPRWSFASLLDGQQSELCRMGDKVGDRVIAGITWRYLFLERDDELCFLDLFSETNLAKREQRPGRRGKQNRVKDQFKSGVKVLGKNERLVERRLMDRVMANPAKFAKTVRFRPQRKNGKIVGYKLRRMRRSSPLSLLGLKRRDVIKGINGIELTSMDKVFEAYQGLKSAKNVRFSITRRGKPVELKIRIQ